MSKRKKKEPIQPIEVQIEDLASMGWITITYMGSENIYFTKNNTRYFIKLG